MASWFCPWARKGSRWTLPGLGWVIPPSIVRSFPLDLESFQSLRVSLIHLFSFHRRRTKLSRVRFYPTSDSEKGSNTHIWTSSLYQEFRQVSELPRPVSSNRSMWVRWWILSLRFYVHPFSKVFVRIILWFFTCTWAMLWTAVECLLFISRRSSMSHEQIGRFESLCGDLVPSHPLLPSPFLVKWTHGTLIPVASYYMLLSILILAVWVCVISYVAYGLYALGEY